MLLEELVESRRSPSVAESPSNRFLFSMGVDPGWKAVWALVTLTSHIGQYLVL